MQTINQTSIDALIDCTAKHKKLILIDYGWSAFKYCHVKLRNSRWSSTASLIGRELYHRKSHADKIWDLWRKGVAEPFLSPQIGADDDDSIEVN